MENKEIDVFDYEGKEYAIIDEIKGIIYSVCINNINDVKLFKSVIKEDGEYVEELTGKEKEQAYANFTDKHKDMSMYIRNILKGNN